MASSISPSAATYPHPTFLIGYSNFPFAAGPAYTPYPPPASTYAATYPYPPPSSTHTPEPPVFSPNWPAWPPHPPDPSPSTAPSTTKGERTTLRDGGVLQSEKSSSAVHPAKPVTCQDGDLGKGSNTSGAPIHGVHKHRGHGTFSKANASTTHRFFMEDEVAVQAAADKRVPTKNTTCHGHQRKHLNLHARLDEQQARDRTAINSLQGQLAKLELMASQMAAAMSMQITEVPTTESSPTVASAPSTSPAAPAYVDPQVLGEMPTSIAWQGTQGIVSNYSSGHHDPIQCSSVSTLSEQNLGPVFDVYDDDMDGCSTEIFDVFLGTPEQQKSDQFANGFCEVLNAFTEGTPERVSHAYDVDTKGRTDESVHVFASPPEQQSYEEEEQDSEQILKCVKAPETEQTIAYLNYLTDVQQRHGVQKASVHVQQLRDPQSNVSVIHEKRKEWDPGALALLHSANSQSDEELGYVAMLVPKALNLCNQVGTCVQQFVTHENEKEWDPGEQTTLSSILNSDIDSVQYHTTQVLLVYSASCRESTENSLTDQKITANASSKVAAPTWHSSLPGAPFILLSNATYTWDPGVPEVLHSYTANHPIGTLPGIFTHVLQPIFASAVKRFIAFGLEWTEVNAAVALSLLVTCSKGKSVAQHSLSSYQTATIAGQTIMFPSSATKSVQMAKHKHPLEFFLLAELQTVSEFSEVQPKYSEINAGPLRHDLQCQSTMSNTTCVWDPGIKFIFYELWWMSKRTGYVLKLSIRSYTYATSTAAVICCSTAKLIQQRGKIAALLSFWHDNLLSSVLCIWELGIVISSSMYYWLNITELIQIKGRTSMTYSGISSPEYPYTMIFLPDQWEFHPRQDVQKNCSAKNLLFSENYLRTWEMDIIFITFLPP